MEPRSEAVQFEQEWPFDVIRPSISEADEAHNLALDAVAEAVGRLPVEALEGHGPIGLVEERDRTVDVIGRSAVLRIIEEARRG